jgi:nucleoside 2-deoxyribosyltransferase
MASENPIFFAVPSGKHPMMIYFCGAILGGRSDLAVYQHVVRYLQSKGHEVPTQHVANPDALQEERSLTARRVYARDEAWIRQSDLLIAEISTPSLGVGYEIGRGLQQGMPVLCLYRTGLEVSKMITGNTAPNLQVQAYQDMEDLNRHIDRFLAPFSPSSESPME